MKIAGVGIAVVVAIAGVLTWYGGYFKTLPQESLPNFPPGSSVTVHIFPNGGGEPPFARHTVTVLRETAAASLFERLPDWVLLGSAEGARLFDGKGLLHQNLLHVDEEAFLYVVPPQKHFVWPFVEIGHRVRVRPTKEWMGEVYLESLSLHPRVFALEGFASDAEMNELKANAQRGSGDNALQRSTIGMKLRSERNLSDPESFSETRTSSNAWDQTSTLAMKLKRRVFDLLRMEFDNEWCDGLQVVLYNTSQAYQAHRDFFPADSPGHNFDPREGGTNRFATVFFYLSDVEAGGNTAFTLADGLSPEQVAKLSPSVQQLVRPPPQLGMGKDLFPENRWERALIDLCDTKLGVRPFKGKAVLFYSQTPMLTLDDDALHAACPVAAGTKWGANLWVWNGPREGGTKNSRVTVDFKNTLEDAGELFWQGPTPVSQSLLQPGEKITQNSFDGHVFYFEVGGHKVWSFKVEQSKGVEQTVSITKQMDH